MISYRLEYLSNDTGEWEVLNHFHNIVDCYISLGKHAEADPDLEHRVIRCAEEVVLHLPTREEGDT